MRLYIHFIYLHVTIFLWWTLCFLLHYFYFKDTFTFYSKKTFLLLHFITWFSTTWLDCSAVYEAIILNLTYVRFTKPVYILKPFCTMSVFTLSPFPDNTSVLYWCNTWTSGLLFSAVKYKVWILLPPQYVTLRRNGLREIWTLTLWCRSCPDPSRRSSGRGQSWAGSVRTHSSSNPPGS